MNYFLDTNLLLDDFSFVKDKFYISNITLAELEHIKTSAHKDQEVKYKARQALHWLDQNKDKYEVINYKRRYFWTIWKNSLINNADSKIIACAYHQLKKDPDLIFVTKDLLAKLIAQSLNIPIKSFEVKEDEYKGYKTVNLNDEELEDFYLHLDKNTFNLLENEYLIINYQGAIVDKYKWQDGIHKKVPYQKFESKMFGKIVPKDGDIYQQLAMDSLSSNQFTILRGGAGSGKTLLSLAYLFSQLEKGKIDRVCVVCNPVAVKGACRLGFYPGTRDEKLLDSQVGGVLVSKLGDRIAVEKMIAEGTLMLVPLVDIRGFDTTGIPTGYYITESQNVDRNMMKLALQRIGEDSIVICEGDDKAQTDLSEYAGDNNGLRRAVEVFKGSSLFGTVTLKHIKRSEIARLAEQIC